jgi:rubrerythrin
MDKNETVDTKPPETIVKVILVCSVCGSQSGYDGNGSEFCPVCRTHEHLVRYEYLYRLVGIEPI